MYGVWWGYLNLKMQCYICLEEIDQPWDEFGSFTTPIRPCCGRPIHFECIQKEKDFSVQCGWCRTKEASNVSGVVRQLKQNVREGRAWAMARLANCYLHATEVPKNLWLARELSRRAIPKLNRDEWDEKIADDARQTLILSTVTDPTLIKNAKEAVLDLEPIVRGVRDHPIKSLICEFFENFDTNQDFERKMRHAIKEVNAACTCAECTCGEC